MRLRTVTGVRWPTKCADHCGAIIPAGDDIKVVIDLDTSRPRLSYIPAHSPDAGTYKPRSEWSTAGAKPLPGFALASAKAPEAPVAAPKAPPAAPEPPKAPAPSPLALMGSGAASDPTPSPQAGVAWATSSLTFNAGAYESAKAGFADYAQAGETPEQLRARVNRVVLEDLERQVRGIRELHERLGDTPRTLSAAPKGAAPSPSSSPSSASAPVAPRGPGTTGGEGAPVHPRGSGTGADPSPTVAELVRQVELELGDTSPRRAANKRVAVGSWLEIRGRPTLHQCDASDESGLRALLGVLDAINKWADAWVPGCTVPVPRVGEGDALPA